MPRVRAAAVQSRYGGCQNLSAVALTYALATNAAVGLELEELSKRPDGLVSLCSKLASRRKDKSLSPADQMASNEVPATTTKTKFA